MHVRYNTSTCLVPKSAEGTYLAKFSPPIFEQCQVRHAGLCVGVFSAFRLRAQDLEDLAAAALNEQHEGLLGGKGRVIFFGNFVALDPWQPNLTGMLPWPNRYIARKGRVWLCASNLPFRMNDTPPRTKSSLVGVHGKSAGGKGYLGGMGRIIRVQDTQNVEVSDKNVHIGWTPLDRLAPTALHDVFLIIWPSPTSTKFVRFPCQPLALQTPQENCATIFGQDILGKLCSPRPFPLWCCVKLGCDQAHT